MFSKIRKNHAMDERSLKDEADMLQETTHTILQLISTRVAIQRYKGLQYLRQRTRGVCRSGFGGVQKCELD